MCKKRLVSYVIVSICLLQQGVASVYVDRQGNVEAWEFSEKIKTKAPSMRNAKVFDYGDIVEDKEILFYFPDGSYKVVSRFRPTEGAHKGKQIELYTVASSISQTGRLMDPKKETSLLLYVKIGNKKARLIGSIALDASFSRLHDVQIKAMIMPNGVVRATRYPKEEDDLEFDLNKLAGSVKRKAKMTRAEKQARKKRLRRKK